MKDLTNNIKKAITGFGILTLLALAPLSLEAQNKDNFKKGKIENYCIYKQSKEKYNLKLYKGMVRGGDYCIANQASKYYRHFHKLMKKRQRG